PIISQVHVNDVLPDQVIVNSGLLLVSADDGANAVSINRNIANVVVSINGVMHSVALTSVQRIVVVARGGDDSVSIGNLAVPFSVDGGDGVDTVRVTGRTTANAFVLSDSSLSVNGIEDDVSAVETLKIIGQAANDTLSVSAGGQPDFAVTYTGGGGINILVGPDAPTPASNNQWVVSGHNAGTLETQTDAGSGNILQSGILSFFSVQKLTGGNGADAWLFKPGGLVDGKLDGAGGTNDLVYGNAIVDTVNLQTGA